MNFKSIVIFIELLTSVVLLRTFTQIPENTSDAIFLKFQKPCFEGIFDYFWSILPKGDFFQKFRLCHTQLYMGP